MAKIDVRYLVKKPGRRGALPRWYWQPAAALRALGFAGERVPANWREIADERRLEAAAIAAAQGLNRKLDAARKASPAAPAIAAPPAEHTVAALIALYRASERFKGLRASTRRGYEQCLDRIGQWAGDAPVLEIDDDRIEVLKRGMRRTPAMRDAVLRVLRVLLFYAVRKKWIAGNPAEKPGIKSRAPSGRIWPAAAVPAFVAMADRLGAFSIGTAVMLDEWIGQREGDVLRLPRTLRRSGGILLRQSKTGAGVALPVDMVAALEARIDAELARLAERFKDAAVQPTRLLIDERTGRPYTEDSFRHRFAEVRAALAQEIPSFDADYLIPGRDPAAEDAQVLATTDLRFMHLRHTAVVRLAEADCDIGLISAITGHSPKSIEIIVATYMVKTRKLARLAFQKRLEAERPAPAATGKEEKA